MKRRCGYFETQPDEHERNGGIGKHGYLSGPKRVPDHLDTRGPGGAEHQRYSVQKESSRE